MRIIRTIKHTYNKSDTNSVAFIYYFMFVHDFKYLFSFFCSILSSVKDLNLIHIQIWYGNKFLYKAKIHERFPVPPTSLVTSFLSSFVIFSTSLILLNITCPRLGGDIHENE
jgi:hypothetical protein